MLVRASLSPLRPLRHVFAGVAESNLRDRVYVLEITRRIAFEWGTQRQVCVATGSLRPLVGGERERPRKRHEDGRSPPRTAPKPIPKEGPPTRALVELRWRGDAQLRAHVDRDHASRAHFAKHSHRQ